MKRTKIIATVGPATQSEEKLQELYNAGVNIIRFNFSHADHENSKKIVERVRKLNAAGTTNLELLLDTKGPEIRTGDLDEKISYEAGEVIKMYVDDSKRTGKDLFCDYEYLIEDINVGDEIMVDSGLCVVKVLSKATDYVEVEIMNAATLGSRRHINLPGVKLKLPGITDKDKQDVQFAVDNNYDYIAMSFVRNKDNIKELRDFLAERDASNIKIISKVENQEAVENLTDIIEYSDAIMVARGDLGIEIKAEEVPYYQEFMVKECNRLGKMVIVATHMLESMIEFPFPTRAEVGDIHQAVHQGANATMLSGESAMGKYPIQAVEMMTRVIVQAEKEQAEQK